MIAPDFGSVNGSVHTLTDVEQVRSTASELTTNEVVVCRIARGAKRPTYDRWGCYSVSPESFCEGDSIGIVGGPLSHCKQPGHALVIVDLDSPDAVAYGDEYLPATGMIEGRAGKPKSHRYYLVPCDTIPADQVSTAEQAAPAAIEMRGHAGPRIRHYRGASGGIVDVIGTGGQVVCPPSVHPSGEVREWEGGVIGEPAVIAYPVLLQAVERLAAACGWTGGSTSPEVQHFAADVDISGKLGYPIFATAMADLRDAEPAIDGSGGSDTLYHVCCDLARMRFSVSEGVQLLAVSGYNSRCVPPWKEGELRHKMADAVRAVERERELGVVSSWDEPGDDEQEAAQAPASRKSRFPFITSSTLSAGDYRPEWLVKNVLVMGQPGVIAGPSKALKTNLAVDLAVSLASGTAFLGKFDVPHPVRVAIVSGESGEHTLQETGSRVAVSKGTTLEALGDRLQWCFDLPRFTDPVLMHDFAQSLIDINCDVVIIDPVYLAMGLDVDMANLIKAGAAFREVGEILKRAGCTPILLHHANRKLQLGTHMKLTDLAYTGLEQYARQFVLLNRASEYEGDGVHEMLMSVGGSVGHGGMWQLRVDEGTLSEDFTGRKWDVSVTGWQQAKENQKSAKEVKEAEKDAKDAEYVCRAIDKFVCEHTGELPSLTELMEYTGWKRSKLENALAKMIMCGIVKIGSERKPIGNGTTRAVKAYQVVH